MNAVEFFPNMMNVGEPIPPAEMAKLNAFVKREGPQEGQHAKESGQRGNGREGGKGGRWRRLPRRNMN
jgi:hypothetical protein